MEICSRVFLLLGPMALSQMDKVIVPAGDVCEENSESQQPKPVQDMEHIWSNPWLRVSTALKFANINFPALLIS